MTKMFPETETDNPYHGCTFGCITCWARELALKFQKNGVKGYENGFAPTFNPLKLQKPPKRAKNLFVCAMGDLFCPGASDSWILDIMDWCHESKHDQNFMFLTKSPDRYAHILDWRPEIVSDKRFMFGATIESNKPSPFSPGAPPTYLRSLALRILRKRFPGMRMFISMEPVMDFDVTAMVWEIAAIKPEIIYIGYDNYRNWGGLEPPMSKVRELIEATQDITKWVTKTLREPL